MPIIYKIMAKVVANRLSPILNKVIMPQQHDFIEGKLIYDNILAAMIGIDYAKLTNQVCILLQFDPDKAYEKIGWSFIACTMRVLGFGLVI